MYQYFGSILIIATVIVYYYLFYKPTKIINNYAKQFQSKGFKVFKFNYSPFGYPIFKTLQDDSIKGDAFSTYKQKFTNVDVIIGNVFANPAIAFLNPQLRKQLAKNQIDFYYQKLPFIRNQFSKILGLGLVLSEGNDWKRKRRIISKFFSFDFINSKIPQIYAIAQKSIQQYEKQIGALKNPQTKQFNVELINLTTRIFSNVILSIFLGSTSLRQKIDGQRISSFAMKLISDYFLRINQPLFMLIGPKLIDLQLTARDRNLKRRINLFNQWAQKYIDNLILNKTKENQKIQPHQNEGKQQVYDKKEMIDELKIFLFAGTDTTSNLLQMMIYLAMKDQRVCQKSRQQVKILNQKQQSISTLKQLKYVQAIQKQTVRTYGPLPLNFPRIVVKDHYFNGIKIYKSSIVQYISTPTHYNQNIYIQPNQFRPERWLQQKFKFDSGELTGFGMGPRSCIGQYLAHIESKIAFGILLNRYKSIKVPEKISHSWKTLYEAQKFQVTVSFQ